jgi:hypothetical protein
MLALGSVLLAVSVFAQTPQPPVAADVVSEHSPAQALEAQASRQPGRVVFLELKNDGGNSVIHSGSVVKAECQVWWAYDCADPPTPRTTAPIPKADFDTVIVRLTLATNDSRRIWFEHEMGPLALNKRRALKLVSILARPGAGDEITLVVRYMGPAPASTEYGFNADLLNVVEKKTGRTTPLLDYLARP